MLRNPLDRVISQYKSFREIKNAADAALWVDNKNGKEALKIARTSSFDEFLLSDNQQIMGHIDNLQVQFLSKDGGRGYSSTKSAIEILENNFFFFGITEYYQNSLRLLSWQLGRRIEHGKHLNASPVDIIEAKSDAAKAALNSYIFWDNFLYEAACEIFRDRMKEFEFLNPEPPYDTFGLDPVPDL
ncbi:hypothetical protein Sj15T_22750 [Sphingobium sp. TA15]|nr:hypothetical protein Sj15T_22750 [Sphingobium sp. TA15]